MFFRFPAHHSFRATVGRPRLVGIGLLAAFVGASFVSPVAASPIPLDLSRRNLKNFLIDEDALAPYRTGGDPRPDLRGVFTIGAIEAPFAIFWDAQSCRLIGILELATAGESDTPIYSFLAAGPHPFAKTAGVTDAPRYFGFRLVSGAPEFLFHCGSVAFEERLWLEDEGRTLKQRFVVKGASKGLKFAVPPSWAKRVDASVGTWAGPVLTVPAESAEVVLTYPLAPPEETPEAETTESN